MDKKIVKKQEIIKKSIHVMFKNGYNGTSVKDLADAAGIPKGSLYNYFENKEDYAKEALYFYYKTMNKKQIDILNNKNLNPLDRVKDFYAAKIKKFEDESNCELGCFVGNLTQEMGGISELLSEATNEIHSDIADKIRSCLVEAIEKGDLVQFKDIDTLAEFIVSSWQGALLRIKVTKSRKILDDFYKILIEVLLK